MHLGFYHARGRHSPPPEAEDQGVVHPSGLNDDDDENEAEFEEQLHLLTYCIAIHLPCDENWSLLLWSM